VDVALKPKIRPATEIDAALLASLGRETFFETFATSHPKNDMDTYLGEVFDVKKILKEFENNKTTFFLATLNGQGIGYAKLKGEEVLKTLGENSRAELERLYILKKWVGHGIGSALMQHILETAKKQGYKVMWLSVWEHNPKAVRFYQRFGFEFSGTTTFKLGKTTRHNHLMTKQLEP